MFNSPSILLISDHAPLLAGLVAALADVGGPQKYEVIETCTGHEALRWIAERFCAVVLLDVDTPETDGFSISTFMRACVRAVIPVICIERRTRAVSEIDHYKWGAADLIHPPLIPDVLKAKVDIFLKLAGKYLELEAATRKLEEVNQNLVVRQMQELKTHNEALQQEVIERRLAEQRAHELATRDPLTGLINRRSLIESLEHALISSKRRDEKLAVLFLDMDRFKTINDTLGHDAGDRLLMETAQRINSAVREEDIVARLGGDEFVIVIKGMPSYEDAAKIASSILAATRSSIYIDQHAVKTSLSIGISLFPQDGTTAQGLIKNADIAMYHAKKEKRGHVHFYSESLNARMLERMALEHELQHALDNDEFELFYQPKVEIATGRIAGLEGLIRWNHPRRGMLTSGKFIDAAVEGGLILDIGEWVICEACAQIRRWRDLGSGLSKVPLAINIAIPQIRPELPSFIRQKLRKYDISASSLQLEITESLLIRDMDRTMAVLRELSEIGITIAIDDFGTGYSSLSRLKALPIDILKIDQSFVRHLEQDLNDSAIIAAIVNMAHTLGLRVVAEGVETDAQLAILNDLHCDEHQGYLCSRPLGASDLDYFVDNQFFSEESESRTMGWRTRNARH